MNNDVGVQGHCDQARRPTPACPLLALALADACKTALLVSWQACHQAGRSPPPVTDGGKSNDAASKIRAMIASACDSGELPLPISGRFALWNLRRRCQI